MTNRLKPSEVAEAAVAVEGDLTKTEHVLRKLFIKLIWSESLIPQQEQELRQLASLLWGGHLGAGEW